MSDQQLPVYDPATPSQNQDWGWDCSQESAQWMLRSWGRNPDDSWMEASLLNSGTVTAEYGLMDASGAGMAAWLNAEYQEFGYVATNDASSEFDDVAAEAATGRHPTMVGGRAWCHWVGCRGYDPSSDTLLIANSADGYLGVGQTLSRGQWASLGPFSLVRLMHPAAEGLGEPESPSPPDLSAWQGLVGSGLLSAMQADNVLPAQSRSTWLPLGSPAADIEECAAMDGTIYRWHLPTGSLWKYPASS